MKDLTLATFAFNTPELTEQLIKSISETNPDLLSKLVIVDNGTESGDLDLSKKYELTYIDNTCNKLGLFKTSNKNELKLLPSNNHQASIQYMIDNCPTDYLLLLDNDVIIKKDISETYNEFKNSGMISSGYLVDCDEWKVAIRMYAKRHSRVHPCFQFLNVRMMKELGAKYHLPCYEDSKDFYDTGSRFYEGFSDKFIILGKIPPSKVTKPFIADLMIHLGSRSVIKEFNGTNAITRKLSETQNESYKSSIEL